MAKNGKAQKVYLVESSGSVDTYNAIAGETSNQLDISSNLIDASDKSSDWTSRIAGQNDWGLSLDVNLSNDATAKQRTFLTSLNAGTKVKVFVGELSSNAPAEGYTGEAYVESVSETRQNGSIMSRSISLKGDGELTPTWPTA